MTQLKFARFVGIDWSGDARGGRGSIAVAQTNFDGVPALVPSCQRWSRTKATEWLIENLKIPKGEYGTLVGFDFGFGYPAGAAKTVFDVETWIDLPFAVRELLKRYGTARNTATKINDSKFERDGPFRLGHEDRRFRFYLRNGISRFRITELFAPGALSVWDVLQGAQVALSTLTGLSALADLIEARGRNLIQFKIFPFEYISIGDNVLAEIYPSLAPRYEYPKGHSGDALRITRWMQEEADQRGAERLIKLPSPKLPYGQQVADVVREEGWILGVTI